MSKLAEELLSEIEDDMYGYSEFKSEEAKTKVIECIDKALARQREACARGDYMNYDILNKIINNSNDSKVEFLNMAPAHIYFTLQYLVDAVKGEIINENDYKNYKFNMKIEENKITYWIEKDNEQVGSSVVFDKINPGWYYGGGIVDTPQLVTVG
jgi:hypothetical protein